MNSENRKGDSEKSVSNSVKSLHICTQSGSNEVKSSKELLMIQGDGSRRAVLKSLLKDKPKNVSKPKIFKMKRSGLFSELNKFLPQIERANEVINVATETEKEAMDIENIDGCEKVVEMNLLVGDYGNSSDSDSSDDTPLTDGPGEDIVANDVSVKCKNKLVEEIDDEEVDSDIKVKNSIDNDIIMKDSKPKTPNKDNKLINNNINDVIMAESSTKKAFDKEVHFKIVNSESSFKSDTSSIEDAPCDGVSKNCKIVLIEEISSKPILDDAR